MQALKSFTWKDQFLCFLILQVIFSVVNLDQRLPAVVNIAFPIQVEVFVTPSLGQREGLAGQVALPESKATPGVLETIISVTSSVWTSYMATE